MSEHVVTRVAARAKALGALARKLEGQAGLAEEDRLGLKVCVELLHEACTSLAAADKMSAAQMEHLKSPAQELLDKGDALAHSATPAQIAKWWRALETAARDFVRAVHDLPHR